MKVLQVNNVYGEKSTGKLTKMVHEELLKAGHESLVAYGRGSNCSGEGIFRICPEWYGKIQSLFSRVSGICYGGCFLSTWRLMSIIRKEKPDVVHLQCINGSFVNIYWLVRWLKKHRIKTIVALHAEFMYTANCGHAFECMQWKHGCKRCPDRKKATKSWFFDRTGQSWKAMQNAFEGFEEDCIIVPVSPWTEGRAKQSDILKDFRFQTVLNGVDADQVFFYTPQASKGPVVLNVTAHFSDSASHAKGGWYLVQLARRMPDVTFVVAGRAEKTGELPDNLILLGEIKDQKKMAELYCKAQLSILVSRRETFSMPCAESLCCGTPVIGFKAGAPEQISLPKYSEFVDFGDIDGLKCLVRKWLEREDLCCEEIAKEAAAAYSAQTMVQTFLDLYRRI